MSWAAFYEGPSDALYLDVLLPRMVRELIAAEGSEPAEVPDAAAVRLGRDGREVDRVAPEICRFKEAFDLVFVHADIGGRGLARRLGTRSDAYCAAASELCGWPPERCVAITPRHETEAWLLADDAAVTAALGYKGDPGRIGLPRDARAAERLDDPKGALAAAIAAASGRRRGQRIDTLFPAIAQRQRLDRLRRARSFESFEERLRSCLRSLGCLPQGSAG